MIRKRERKLVFCGNGYPRVSGWLRPYSLSHNTMQIDFTLPNLNDTVVNEDKR